MVVEHRKCNCASCQFPAECNRFVCHYPMLYQISGRLPIFHSLATHHCVLAVRCSLCVVWRDFFLRSSGFPICSTYQLFIDNARGCHFRWTLTVNSIFLNIYQSPFVIVVFKRSTVQSVLFCLFLSICWCVMTWCRFQTFRQCEIDGCFNWMSETMNFRLALFF